MAASGNSLTCHRCGAAYAPEHRFCGACGTEVGSPAPPSGPAPAPPARPTSVSSPDASEEINRLTGAPYDPSASAQMPRAEERDDALPYYIPPTRVVLLTLLSAGLYIFYWMYLTWRHYREHTGDIAYPVFHALTLLVPVYNLFRLHAHMRVYQELMEARGVPTTLNPVQAVLMYFGVFLLGMVSIMLPAEAPITPAQQAAYAVINVGQSTLVAWILWQAQGNLNRFWQHRLGTRLGWAPFSPAELALVALGFLLGWGVLAVILIDPTLIPAEPSTVPEPALTPSP